MADYLEERLASVLQGSRWPTKPRVLDMDDPENLREAAEEAARRNAPPLPFRPPPQQIENGGLRPAIAHGGAFPRDLPASAFPARAPPASAPPAERQDFFQEPAIPRRSPYAPPDSPAVHAPYAAPPASAPELDDSRFFFAAPSRVDPNQAPFRPSPDIPFALVPSAPTPSIASRPLAMPSMPIFPSMPSYYLRSRSVRKQSPRKRSSRSPRKRSPTSPRKRSPRSPRKSLRKKSKSALKSLSKSPKKLKKNVDKILRKSPLKSLQKNRRKN
jgi:hypothetical protein